MPSYFFAVEGSTPDPEQVGLELPGPEAARNEAVRAMADLIGDIDGAAWNSGDWVMRVTDEAGQTVGTLHFRGDKGPEG